MIYATSVCRYGGIPCGLFTVPGRATRAAPYRLSNLWPPSILPIYLRVSPTGLMRRNGIALSCRRAMRRRLFTAPWLIRLFPLGMARYAADGWQCPPGPSQFGKTALPRLRCRSLGQGLSIANGIALALKLRHETPEVFCLIGDGEQQEGQIWEAAALPHSTIWTMFV